MSIVYIFHTFFGALLSGAAIKHTALSVTRWLVFQLQNGNIGVDFIIN